MNHPMLEKFESFIFLLHHDYPCHLGVISMMERKYLAPPSDGTLEGT